MTMENQEALSAERSRDTNTASPSHTPGPWEWHKRFTDQGRNGSVFHLKREGHAYAVAMQPQYVSAEQWEADARLIAAAPDSHAANIAFVKAITEEHRIPAGASDDYIYDTIGSALAEAFFLARAAIAKATQ